ncbi:MAG: RNA polymerase sigma factor RpoD/SigA [Dehalococcoidia bacterium]
MIGVLEEAKGRERASFGDGNPELDGELIGLEEGSDESEVVPDRARLDLGENLLSLYFADVGRTKMLADEEVRELSRQIEEAKYLTELEGEVIGGDGVQPSSIELLVALLERVGGAHTLFEALYRHVDLPLASRVVERIRHPDLRSAIDNKVDPQFLAAVAELTGMTQDAVEKAIVELSVASRLVPWDVLERLPDFESLAELGEIVQAPEIAAELEKHGPEIADHFARIRERARMATDRMVRANLRLVVGVAKKHTGWGVPLSDLIQEGNIGLMHAVRKFDHRRGCRFSTYAVPWIWQAINRAANDQSRVVRLPGYLVDDLTRLLRVRTKLVQQLGRQPTEDELASETGLPADKVESLLKIGSSAPVSYDTPVGEEGARLGDFIADRTAVQPEDEADANMLKEELNRTLESLLPRERRILELRFGLDGERSRTLKEVGAELRLTKERVRQIEKEALAKLRHPSHSRELIGFLG